MEASQVLFTVVWLKKIYVATFATSVKVFIE
jgi:hypothetical protein